MRDGQYEKFKNFIRDYKYSERCYRVAGDACFIVKLSLPSLENTEEFINSDSSYAMAETSIVFSEVEVKTNIDNYL